MGYINQKNSAKFENHASDVLCMKKLHFISWNLCKENGNVECRPSPIKIHYADYPKWINEGYVFLIKYPYS